MLLLNLLFPRSCGFYYFYLINMIIPLKGNRTKTSCYKTSYYNSIFIINLFLRNNNEASKCNKNIYKNLALIKQG